MDALGAAQAVLALALLPGGLVLALSGWVAQRLGGRSSLWSFDARELFTLLLLDLAVAQAPLPASPIPSLPPGSGSGPDIAVVALLIAGALAAATSPGRPGWRWVSAAAAVTAVLALGFGAASLSLSAIVGQPGASLLAARIATAAAILVAAPALTSSWRLSSAAEATLLAGIGLIALSLVVPAGLPAWAAAAATTMAAAGAAGYAAAAMRWRDPLSRVQPSLGVVCLLSGAAALAAVLVSVLA